MFSVDAKDLVGAGTICSEICMLKKKLNISLKFTFSVIFILLICIINHKIEKNMSFHLIYDLSEPII